jgi:hypothetical protein
MKEKSDKQENPFNIYQLLFSLEEIIKVHYQCGKVEDWQYYINGMNARYHFSIRFSDL